MNFNNHIGVQGGFRRLSVFYQVEEDTGQMKMKGLYFGAVARSEPSTRFARSGPAMRSEL